MTHNGKIHNAETRSLGYDTFRVMKVIEISDVWLKTPRCQLGTCLNIVYIEIVGELHSTLMIPIVCSSNSAQA